MRFVDFRKLENREEAFLTWYEWGLTFNDVDPAIFLTNYLFRRYELNSEQKLWFNWLYGVTYNLPTAWIIWNEFPDFHLVGEERMEKWNAEYGKRLRFQSDTKWNRGHLPAMFKSYKEWVGEGNPQSVKYSELGSPETRFWGLWRSMDDLFKFGRYAKFFTLQHLKHTCGIDIDCPTLFLEDLSGSKSHREGLMFAAGKEAWIQQELNPHKLEFLTEVGNWLLSKARERFGHLNPDFFSMETALCSFKKLFRTQQGRYCGYYIDRQGQDISKCATDGWKGIAWIPLFEGRWETIHPNLLENTISNPKMHLFTRKGTFHHLDLLKTARRAASEPRPTSNDRRK